MNSSQKTNNDYLIFLTNSNTFLDQYEEYHNSNLKLEVNIIDFKSFRTLVNPLLNV